MMFRKNRKTGNTFVPTPKKHVSGLTVAKTSDYDKAVSNLGMNAYEINAREKNLETSRFLAQHAVSNPSVDTMTLVNNMKTEQQQVLDLRVEEQQLLRKLHEQSINQSS